MSTFTPSRAAARISAFAAIACFAVMAVMVVVAGALTPEYSHASQFISELGARGAPQEWVVRFGGFLPAGILLLAFCLFAFIALPRSPGATLGLAGLAIFGAGYLVAAAFPCDLGCRPDEPSTSQLIHNAGGLVGYLLAPAFLLILALASRRWPLAGRMAIAGYAATALAVIGLFTLDPDSGTAGISQRILEFAVLGWAVCCGIYLARGSTRLDHLE
jgi:uncharacterized protein DUF998